MRASTAQPATRRRLDRIVGVYEGARPGKTVIAIGGMHGNEPAGIEAIRSVLGQLRERGTDVAGKLVGVAGNLQALQADQRFLTRDLNRGWTVRDCERLATPSAADTPEDLEQRQLLEVFGPLEAESDEPLVFVDLHSTSGPAAPFSIIPDVERNRRLALSLPIPTVLGLEEILEGAMFGYLCDRGHMGLAVEGGQHRDPETAARLEAVVWLTMLAAGTITAHDVPDLRGQRKCLRDATAGLPTAVRVRHRHGLDDEQSFEMVPGFDNFSPVRRGERLAQDEDGPVHADFDGLVMLPRYQGQGNDGFFLASRVTRRWLTLSAAARRGKMERWLALWPGLARVPSEPNRLRYRGTEPPPLMLQTLRLLGFHGMRAKAAGLEFFRRRP
ncbi:MAG: succinylglutamate desuccinylase/aspartoacylase family protein [Myxococcota bacterium]